ncbi:alpha/beta hydrolase [Streptomyces mutabilis]|uniref:alpha/beta fold hydrolase n=1 Tax=Streptomyces mutabilis TaxID=67332 RepID=UPI0033A37D41
MSDQSDNSPSVVLLPPVGNDARTWDFVDLPDGARRHRFPGFGRPRAEAALTMAGLADEVVAMHPGRLHLVGVSMGGMVALNAALRHPDRVASVLVACTGASASPAVMEQRAVAAETGGMSQVLHDTLTRWFTPAALSAAPAHPGVVYARTLLLNLDQHAFAAGWRAIATHDTASRLGRLSMPVTAVAGGQDRASALSRSEEIAERAPHGRLVVVDDAPHMIQLEQPAALGRIITEHLEWAAESRS